MKKLLLILLINFTLKCDPLYLIRRDCPTIHIKMKYVLLDHLIKTKASNSEIKKIHDMLTEDLAILRIYCEFKKDITDEYLEKYIRRLKYDSNHVHAQHVSNLRTSLQRGYNYVPVRFVDMIPHARSALLYKYDKIMKTRDLK